MLNPTEKDERQYFDSIKEKLQDALKRIDDRVRQYAGELRDQKEYLYENKPEWIMPKKFR